MEYPWYEIVDNARLEQGDLISDCPVVIPPNKVEAGGRFP